VQQASISTQSSITSPNRYRATSAAVVSGSSGIQISQVVKTYPQPWLLTPNGPSFSLFCVFVFTEQRLQQLIQYLVSAVRFAKQPLLVHSWRIVALPPMMISHQSVPHIYCRTKSKTSFSQFYNDTIANKTAKQIRQVKSESQHDYISISLLSIVYFRTTSPFRLTMHHKIFNRWYVALARAAHNL